MHKKIHRTAECNQGLKPFISTVMLAW